MGNITNTKSNKIQILRGLAIIGVIFIHNTPVGLCQVIIKPFFNYAVALFLFLSGLLSNRADWKPKKRIIKVFIPYAVWTFLYVVFSDITNPASIPFSLVKRLMLADSSVMMYYIFVYIQFTLLIPLIDKIARSKYSYLPFIIAPLEIAVMRLLPLLCGVELYPVLQKIKAVSCLPWFTFFYLGYLLGNNLIKIKLSTVKLVFAWFGSVIIQILAGYGRFLIGDKDCGTQLKLSALLTASVVLLLSYKFISGERDIGCKVLKILGDHSFGIYFSHMAVIKALGLIPYYTSVITYPLNAVITIVISLLFCMLGRKVLGTRSKYLGL